MLRELLLIGFLRFVTPLNIVGWYVSDKETKDPNFKPSDINFNIYTHIKSGTPIVTSNGVALCDKTDIITQQISRIAHKYDVKVQWGLGFDYNPTNPNKTFEDNYLNSIGNATKECNIDGIEVDYEWHNNNWGKLGFIPHYLSTRYSIFLKNIKEAIGKNKVVSADVTGMGIYLLGINPWINVTMLNQGDFDFINTMSYYWNKEGEIYRWRYDMHVFKHIWKMDPKRVHIGIPYFSKNKTINEPSWKILSNKCPNIDPSLNICDNVLFVGKEMNMRIGELIKKNGFGGAFPWAANYDSIQNNNSLIYWLYKGLN